MFVSHATSGNPPAQNVTAAARRGSPREPNF
jgi:hypothetical protein